MPASFASLSANNIGAGLAGFMDVLHDVVSVISIRELGSACLTIVPWGDRSYSIRRFQALITTGFTMAGKSHLTLLRVQQTYHIKYTGLV
jgi:hypothetical protein